MKKQLVVAAISTLLLSNTYTVYHHVKKVRQLESKITQQETNIHAIYNKNKLINNTNDKLENELDEKNIVINSLKVEVSNKAKTIKKHQSQIIKLKKQLQEEIKRRKEYPSVSSNYEYYEVSFYTSGYESTQKSIGDKGYGVTASGTMATEGRTVAAPPHIPFGTKIYIEGVGIRVVEDRGGAIVNGHLDVYVESVDKAIRLGRKTLKVKVLGKG